MRWLWKKSFCALIIDWLWMDDTKAARCKRAKLDSLHDEFFFLLMLCDVSSDEIRKHWLYFSRPGVWLSCSSSSLQTIFASPLFFFRGSSATFAGLRVWFCHFHQRIIARISRCIAINPASHLKLTHQTNIVHTTNKKKRREMSLAKS